MTAYVIGAGLAGLSASVALAAKGEQVVLFEAAGQAGGRCRSYFDAGFGSVIDNGNHFVLSGNRAVMDYVRDLGSEHALVKLDDEGVSFVDFRDGARWRIAPNMGIVPLWVFDKTRRVPGTEPADYLALARLMFAGRKARIPDVLSCRGVLWERLLKPFFIGALNCEPENASAALAGAVVRGSFARGGRAYRVRIAHPTLASAFVEPALARLATAGAQVNLGQRLRRMVFDVGKVVALEFPDRILPVSGNDVVVLAVPPWVAHELIPKLVTPNEFRSIVNAHFKIIPPKGAAPMLGIIGGVAEFVFAFEDRFSVTVSAADAIVDKDREELARILWADVARAHGLGADLPPWQIVKEKRATFAATPEQDARRPRARTHWRNLFLAGDWTDTGLPATIEGALRSGANAARLALAEAKR